jgi:hypothetical protein
MISKSNFTILNPGEKINKMSDEEKTQDCNKPQGLIHVRRRRRRKKKKKKMMILTPLEISQIHQTPSFLSSFSVNLLNERF